jgi:CBS domain containing-hemolysin-like protein
VGGYVMSKLGRIAAVGDTVPVEGGTLSVTRMDGRRIDRICFRPAKSDPEAGDGTGRTNNGRTNNDRTER